MVANNAGGEKTLTHGKTIDYILELKVVLSDGLEQKIKQDNFEGEIYKKIYKLVTENSETIQNAKPKVSKNSTGYNLWDVWDGVNFDLTKLFVGSQGTLGLVRGHYIKKTDASQSYSLSHIREKLLDYVLSETHATGKFKAKFFCKLGFDEANVRLFKNN